MRQRLPPLSNDEAVQVALARYEALRLKGKVASYKELSRRFSRDPSVLVRGVARAFREGLVAVQPTRSRQLEEDVALQNQLRRRFPIDTAIVVRPPAQGVAVGGSDGAEDLPRLLGDALARHIANSALFRRNENLGVGSGRGCFWTARALSECPPLTPREIGIYSLAGSWGGRRPPYVNHVVDADANAATLLQAFKEKARLRQMLAPLVAEGSRSKLLATSWVQKDESTRMHYLLAGAGLLLSYGQWSRRNDSGGLLPEDEALTAPIRPWLDELEDLSDRFASRDDDGVIEYCPVGDLGNYLMFVPPDDENAIPSPSRERIHDLVSLINRHLVTPQRRFWFTGHAADFLEDRITAADIENSARNGPRLILIAGGREKAAVVRHILRARFPVSVLCVDSEVAEALLRISRHDRGNPMDLHEVHRRAPTNRRATSG